MTSHHNESRLDAIRRILNLTRRFSLALAMSVIFSFTTSLHAQDQQVADGLFATAVPNGSGTSNGLPEPNNSRTFDSNIDPYSGSLRAYVPLVNVGGRGAASFTVSVSFEPEIIYGTGMYPCCDSSLKTLYDSSNSFIKDYYNKLIRFGAGYGPGVLYARWTSFEGGWVVGTSGSANFYTLRRPARLTFVDSSGRKHTLQDQEVVGEQILQQLLGGVQRYAGSFNWYRNKNEQGKVYVSTEDNGMIFISDSIITVPNPQTAFTDHDNNLYDVPIMPSGNLYLRDGSQLRILQGYPAWMRDRNGNTLRFTYQTTQFSTGATGPLKRVTQITDSLDRVVNITYGSNTVPDEISYTGFNGASQVIKVQRTRLDSSLQTGETLKSLASLYPEAPQQLQFFSAGSRYNPEVFSYIEYPDSKRITFKYNSYGELVSVTNPSGSLTKYEYAGGTVDLNGPFKGGALQLIDFGWPVPDGFGGTQNGYYYAWYFYRRLIKASNFLDASTLRNSVTYSRPESPGDDCPTCVKVDTFDASNTHIARQKHFYFDKFTRQHFITLATLIGDFPKWSAGLEDKVESYTVVAGTPQLVSTVQNTWTHGPFNVTPGSGLYVWWNGDVDKIYNADRPRVTKIRTTLHGVTPNLISEKVNVYDEYLNVTDVTEFDYGSGAPGVFLRRTHTDFLTINPVNSVDYRATPVHIIGLPTSRKVYSDSAGTTIASRADYEYDQYTNDGNLHSPLKSRLAIVGHCLNYDSFGQCTAAPDTEYKMRGNPTAETTFANANAGTGAVSRYTKYDIAGNVVSNTDPNGNVAELEYDDTFSVGNKNTFAFATLARTAVPDPSGLNGANVRLTTSKVFDYYTGLLVTDTDANNQVTTNSYNDPETGALDPRSRLRKTTRPDGSWTIIDYGDTPGNLFVRTRVLTQATPERILESYQYLDNEGRTIRNLAFDGSDPQTRNWIASDCYYDAFGRKVKTSNPYFALVASNARDTAQPGAVMEYDGVGRVRSVTTPDGGKTITAYLGNAVMVTDQANRSRRSETDAAGRLVKIVEYTAAVSDPNVVETPPASAITTSYEYDALDCLRKIRQSSQTPRDFVYDSLRRLKSAWNPEDGTFTYEYDNNSNLKSRVDARNIKTEYTYDAMNRATRKTYSIVSGAPVNYIASPTVDIYFDGTGMPINTPAPANSKGRTTAVKSSVSQNINTEFDVMGRVKKHLQVTDGMTFQTSYTYDLTGKMRTETYPSGRIVETEYDDAGRISGVKNASNNYYMGSPLGENGVEYAANGAPRFVKLGSGQWEHTVFNLRQQVTELGVGTNSTDSSVLKLTYTYGLVINNTLDATKNNGNLQSQSIVAPGLNVKQTYEYDYLNRISDAKEFNTATPTVNNWRQVYKYDAYGNRNFDTGTTTTDPNSAITNSKIRTDNYHIDHEAPGQGSVTYDATGNLTKSVTGQTFSYNSENQQANFLDGNLAAGGAVYSYDGEGKRIKKVTASGTVVFVYDIRGFQIAEYGGPASPAGISYLSNDVLGTPRLVISGSNISRHDYHPFGDEISRTVAGYNGGDTVRQQFTGKERDTESGLDFFGARYYSSTLGRFTTPDEFNGGPSELFTTAVVQNPTFYADLTNPQTLNKYEYANNNPLRFVDPTGHAEDSIWTRFLNWATNKTDPQRAAEEEAAAPWQFSLNGLAAWYYTNLGDTYLWGAETFEMVGLDFGTTEWAKAMATDRPGQEPDYFGITKASVGMSVSILGAVAGAEGGGLATKGVDAAVDSVSPSAIRFSQRSVSGLDDVVKSMAANGWKGEAIDVVRMSDGGLTTVDNTRVLASHLAGIDAKVRIHEGTSKLPSQFIERFTTDRGGVPKTWEDAVLNRIGNQGAKFRNQYPMGSPITGISPK